MGAITKWRKQKIENPYHKTIANQWQFPKHQETCKMAAADLSEYFKKRNETNVEMTLLF